MFPKEESKESFIPPISPLTPMHKTSLFFDILPGVSNAKSLITLFLKAISQCLPDSFVQKSRFWTHIKETNVKYNLLLLFVPFFSNILAIGVFCLQFKHERVKTDIMNAIADDDNRRLNQILEADSKFCPTSLNFHWERATPLFKAFHQSNLEAALILIRYGAKLSFQNEIGVSLQECLDGGQWLELAQALEEQQRGQEEVGKNRKTA